MLVPIAYAGVLCQTFGNLKHHFYIHNVPAILRVLFLVILAPSAATRVHFTTVPFSMTEAVNVRLEDKSDTVVPFTVVELAEFVTMSIRSRTSHSVVEISLQFTVFPGTPGISVTLKSSSRGVETFKFKKAPCLTVQV